MFLAEGGVEVLLSYTFRMERTQSDSGRKERSSLLLLHFCNGDTFLRLAQSINRRSSRAIKDHARSLAGGIC